MSTEYSTDYSGDYSGNYSAADYSGDYSTNYPTQTASTNYPTQTASTQGPTPTEEIYDDVDPILRLNQVILDISMSDSYGKDKLYNEVKKIHENYSKDVEYMGTIHTLIDNVRGSSLVELEKNVNHKKKQQDIQDYYDKKYQQQIFILKIVIVLALFVMAGCLVYNYGIISIYILVVYLGFVLSVGFVVVFYYLWDLFLRDNSQFDEYNFAPYMPPKVHGKLDRTKNKWWVNDSSNNNILC